MLKKVIIGLIIAFGIAQFFKAPRNEVQDVAQYHASIQEEFAIPDDVHELMVNVCYDCHSEHTEYPWYNFVPVDHWMYSHVRVGKKQFNFSTLSELDDADYNHKWDEFVDQMDRKMMPLYAFKWTHKDARLTDEEIKLLRDWAASMKR